MWFRPEKPRLKKEIKKEKDKFFFIYILYMSEKFVFLLMSEKIHIFVFDLREYLSLFLTLISDHIRALISSIHRLNLREDPRFYILNFSVHLREPFFLALISE